jgi:hypothetical protein
MKAAIILSLFITTLWAIQGDIVLSDKLHPQVQLSWSVDAGKMTDTQFYDMIARFYGAPRTPSHDQLRINVDLFSRPQGYLLFSIGGLSSSQMPQVTLKQLSKNLIDLIPSDEIVSSGYQLLASVLTGTSGHIHGVHDHVGIAKDVYSIGNFFDAMHRLYKDKEIVSGSSSLDGALVLSPHLKNLGQLTTAVSWNPKTRSFGAVGGVSSKYAFGIKDFATEMNSLASSLQTEINYNEAEGTVTISGITFDLSSSPIENLFAEVLFTLRMAESPVHFFSFHFDSLSEIANQYGSASDEYVIAVRMIDSAIAKVYSEYKLHHSLEMSIIYSPAAFQNKQVVEAIQPILANNIKAEIGKDLFTTISNSLPNIYLSEEGKTHESDLCNSLTSALDKFYVGVKCSIFIKRHITEDTNGTTPAPAPGTNPNNGPSHVPQSEVELVHIVLWLVVAMICALLQACYHLSVLDGSNEPEFKPKTYEGGLRSKTTKM